MCIRKNVSSITDADPKTASDMGEAPLPTISTNRAQTATPGTWATKVVKQVRQEGGEGSRTFETSAHQDHVLY
jgi:hypothetical protein